MKLLFVILLYGMTFSDGVATVFVDPAVFDLNFFKCMWQREFKCPHSEIDYVLFTPQSKFGKIIDPKKFNALNRAGFQNHHDSVFIIHGFNGTHTDTHMRYLRDAYLSRKFNVIMVNWQRLTFYPCYFSSLSNTKLVGQCTAQIYSLMTHNGQSTKQITCVGHSLGAHICGMISNHLSRRQYKIIGLDPARPLVERHGSRSYRLTRDDANVVQIIHTNAGVLGQVSFSGTVHFCMNGGAVQPFCKGNYIRASRCSHFLSVCYLANAMFKHKLFPSVPCPNRCMKSTIFPFTGKPYTSNIVNLMHIGQDVPDELRGGFCLQADYVKHCPFND